MTIEIFELELSLPQRRHLPHHPGRRRAGAHRPRRADRRHRGAGPSPQRPGRQPVRRARLLRARRSARAEPAPGRVRRGRGRRAPGRRRLRPRGRSRVGHRAPRRRRRPPHRGAAPPPLAALRRDGEALRLDRSGRPGDDAAHRLDAGLPGLVAGRRGAGAVPGAAARRAVARRGVRPQHRPRARGSRPGWRSTRTARRSTAGSSSAILSRPTRGSRAAPPGSPSRT